MRKQTSKTLSKETALPMRIKCYECQGFSKGSPLAKIWPASFLTGPWRKLSHLSPIGYAGPITLSEILFVWPLAPTNVFCLSLISEKFLIVKYSKILTDCWAFLAPTLALWTINFFSPSCMPFRPAIDCRKGKKEVKHSSILLSSILFSGPCRPDSQFQTSKLYNYIQYTQALEFHNFIH